MIAIGSFTLSGNLAEALVAINCGCRIILNSDEWSDVDGNDRKNTHAYRVTIFGILAKGVMDTDVHPKGRGLVKHVSRLAVNTIQHGHYANKSAPDRHPCARLRDAGWAQRRRP
jgi:hypothetical protein